MFLRETTDTDIDNDTCVDYREAFCGKCTTNTRNTLQPCDSMQIQPWDTCYITRTAVYTEALHEPPASLEDQQLACLWRRDCGRPKVAIAFRISVKAQNPRHNYRSYLSLLCLGSWCIPSVLYAPRPAGNLRNLRNQRSRGGGVGIAPIITG